MNETTGPPHEPVRGWRSLDVLRAVALGVAVFYGLRLLWATTPILIMGFLGVMFGLALSSAVDRLEALRVPRGLGAAGIALLFYGLLVGAGMLMAPTLRQQAREIRTRLPEAVDRLDDWMEQRSDGFLGVVLSEEDTATAAPDGVAIRISVDTAAAGDGAPEENVDAVTPPGGRTPADTAATPPDSPAAEPGSAQRSSGGVRQPAPRTIVQIDTMASETSGTLARPVRPPRGADSLPGIQLRERLGQWLRSSTRHLSGFLTSTASAIAGILVVTFVAIYLAAEPDTYRRGLLSLLPRRSRRRAREVMAATANVLRRWLVTQLIAMVAIGTITTIALLILRVPAAYALGLIAGVLEFIPYIGPILAAVPAIGMAFLESPEKALWVAITYIVIQQIESNVVTPLLMKERLKLPPILTIVTQGMMALLFGFLGMLVAVPLLAGIMVPIRMLYVDDVLGGPERADGDEGGGHDQEAS